DRVDAVIRGRARDVEPAAAPMTVQPAFGADALRVVAVEEIIGPGRVVDRLRSFGAQDVPFSAAAEFAFGPRAAPGTVDQQHVSPLNAQCRTRRLRRSARRCGSGLA